MDRTNKKQLTVVSAAPSIKRWSAHFQTMRVLGTSLPVIPASCDNLNISASCLGGTARLPKYRIRRQELGKAALAVDVFVGALPGTLPASTLHIVPTTTLQAQTSNNTSAANSFQSQSNGNLGATNVSKVNMHSLLYPGNRTKIYAHFMPWFGDPRHMSVGYDSQDPAQIHRQIGDMISRGINGVIIDWYGSRDTFKNTNTLRVLTEEALRPGLKLGIMIHKGAI